MARPQSKGNQAAEKDIIDFEPLAKAILKDATVGICANPNGIVVADITLTSRQLLFLGGTMFEEAKHGETLLCTHRFSPCLVGDDLRLRKRASNQHLVSKRNIQVLKKKLDPICEFATQLCCSRSAADTVLCSLAKETKVLRIIS